MSIVKVEVVKGLFAFSVFLVYVLNRLYIMRFMYVGYIISLIIFLIFVNIYYFLRSLDIRVPPLCLVYGLLVLNDLFTNYIDVEVVSFFVFSFLVIILFQYSGFSLGFDKRWDLIFLTSVACIATMIFLDVSPIAYVLLGPFWEYLLVKEADNKFLLFFSSLLATAPYFDNSLVMVYSFPSSIVKKRFFSSVVFIIDVSFRIILLYVSKLWSLSIFSLVSI